MTHLHTVVRAGNAVTQNDAQRQRCPTVWAMVFERMNLASGIAPQHNFVAQTAQRNRVVLHKSRGTHRKPQVFQADFQGGIDGVKLNVDDMGIHVFSLLLSQAAANRAISCR